MRYYNKIIFLDETHIKINEIPKVTLVTPSEKPYVVVGNQALAHS